MKLKYENNKQNLLWPSHKHTEHIKSRDKQIINRANVRNTNK